ncbi:hypothetical protein JCM14036_09860 [Desulfotomaculum defluvii]
MFKMNLSYPNKRTAFIILIVLITLILAKFHLKDLYLNLKSGEVEGLKDIYIGFINDENSNGDSLISASQYKIQASYIGNNLYVVRVSDKQTIKKLFLVEASFSKDKWYKEGLDALNLSYSIVPLTTSSKYKLPWER